MVSPRADLRPQADLRPTSTHHEGKGLLRLGVNARVDDLLNGGLQAMLLNVLRGLQRRAGRLTQGRSAGV